MSRGNLTNTQAHLATAERLILNEQKANNHFIWKQTMEKHLEGLLYHYLYYL